MDKEVVPLQAKDEPAKKEFERPPLDLWGDLKAGVRFILFDPHANLIVMPILLLLESIALKVIVKRVAYTEIDYRAYMEQVEMITDEGQLNYSFIEGGTGPLVYPAGHVLLYKFMHWVTESEGTGEASGSNIAYGQIVFRYLYLVTLFLQFIIFQMLQLPPWCVVLSCLSKRLHSIYVLRLFNDCFTTLFMTVTVLCFVIGTKIKRNRLFISIVASLFYSVAVSVKMNALLYFPAVIISLYLLNEGQLFKTVFCGAIMLIWQVIVALPFLRSYPREYLNGAFNFGRQFMFEWSINWQFLGEEGFHNRIFHISLLMSHLITLMTLFLCQYPGMVHDLLSSLRHPLQRTKTGVHLEKVIPLILVVSNFIGVFFSRSLHYQFLSWYHWTIPMLMHWSHMPWFLGPLWYVLHEYCWNAYPPNEGASALLMLLNGTLLLLLAYFQGTTTAPPTVTPAKKHV